MAKKTTKTETKQEQKKETALAPTRGRIFEGTVVRKFHKRVAIEFERTVYIQKFESFYKKKTRLHARLPDAMAHEINVGDYIQVHECRPLSKIIHFIVTKKIRSAGQTQAETKEAKK